MDHGIKAIWYDLADDGLDDYLAWLHETHFPEIMARPGYLWVAHYEITGGGEHMDKIGDVLARAGAGEVGTGTDYLILLGAASPHVFNNPSAAQLAEKTSPRDREMQALRIGTRVCQFTEEARVDGPEVGLRPPGTTPGPAIQMGSFCTKTVADEFDLGAWYTQYRLPAIAAMPGCIGARKLVSTAGWAKHSVLYEYTSLAAREEHFQKHESLALDKEVWTNKIINYTIHAPGSPSVGERIWPV